MGHKAHIVPRSLTSDGFLPLCLSVERPFPSACCGLEDK